MEIKIDGVAYGWGDITFNYGGHLIKDIQSIDIKTKKEKKLIYGASREPQGSGHGRISREGKISLGFDGANQLKELSDNGELWGLPPQTLTMAVKKESGSPVLTFQYKVEFTEDVMKWKEGDISSSNDYDLLVHSGGRKK